MKSIIISLCVVVLLFFLVASYMVFDQFGGVQLLDVLWGLLLGILHSISLFAFKFAYIVFAIMFGHAAQESVEWSNDTGSKVLSYVSFMLPLFALFFLFGRNEVYIDISHISEEFAAIKEVANVFAVFLVHVLFFFIGASYYVKPKRTVDDQLEFVIRRP